ncbi:MAG: hypothetical protein ACRD45_16595 [Bryobacteraceae bacterium]
MTKRLASVWALGFGIFCSVALGAHRPPHLLLTPRRLHRLKLDAQRQTPRWMDFAQRLKTVFDSPQRGFELALYSVVTGDRGRGKQAVQWAAAHPCDLRQGALVRDWLGGPPDAASACNPEPAIEHARDRLFQAIANGQNAEAVYKAEWKPMLAKLEAGAFRDPRALYAAVEFIDAVRINLHIDPRQDDRTFFAQLPVEFLLSLKPEQVEHPGWRTHAAALALVTLDPNLPASQYLQGWAMENGQMVRTGPGVAYEFLWADPYLPGIGYQNLDPWVYDPHGRLFARKNWSANACWLEISAKGVQEQNCPAGWRAKPAAFGRLMLIPMDQKCLTVTPARKDHAAIIWHLPPGQKLRFKVNGKRDTAHADSIGLWRVASAARGKVCLAR